MAFDDSPDNAVLRAIPKGMRPGIRYRIERLDFEAGQVFWAADDPLRFALFPVRGVISLQLPAPPVKAVEIAMVGNEGFAGLGLLRGRSRAVTAACASTDGEAYSMSSGIFKACLRSSAFRSAVEEYAGKFTIMLARFAACDLVHPVEQHYIGRLLMLHDRVRMKSVPLTQAMLALLIGVRRATVNRIAVGLAKKGLIEYDNRGNVTILDRKRLEKMACSCYKAILREYEEPPLRRAERRRA